MCECLETFRDGLHYVTPALGGWGSMRTSMLVPECHVLYVIPAACGRHGAIAAYIHGVKDRLSYLFLKEEDIVAGSYEDKMIEAVGEILEVLEKRPKAMILFVSCLDDLLGTDHQAILDVLHGKYEDMRFTFCHMNPIATEGKRPPGVTLQLGMFGLLEKRKEEKNNTINLIGSQVKPDKACELYEIVKLLGVEKVNHITDYDLFDEWQEMAQSQLNLITLKTARKACKEMEKKFDIPYLEGMACYDPDMILKRYQEMAEFFGKELPKVTYTYYENAVSRLKQTAKKFKDVNIVVSHSCTVYPFGMALLLKKYGFQVVEVMAERMKADKTSREKLEELYPEIKISLSTHHGTVKYQQMQENVLAMGMQAGYLGNCKHVVTLAKDEGMFGFYGIERLMDMMEDAWNNEVDLEKRIKESGLVV